MNGSLPGDKASHVTMHGLTLWIVRAVACPDSPGSYRVEGRFRKSAVSLPGQVGPSEFCLGLDSCEATARGLCDTDDWRVWPAGPGVSSFSCTLTPRGA